MPIDTEHNRVGGLASRLSLVRLRNAFKTFFAQHYHCMIKTEKMMFSSYFLSYIVLENCGIERLTLYFFEQCIFIHSASSMEHKALISVLLKNQKIRK